MKKRRHPGGVFFFVMETRKKISLAFFVTVTNFLSYPT